MDLYRILIFERIYDTSSISFLPSFPPSLTLHSQISRCYNITINLTLLNPQILPVLRETTMPQFFFFFLVSIINTYANHACMNNQRYLLHSFTQLSHADILFCSLRTCYAFTCEWLTNHAWKYAHWAGDRDTSIRDYRTNALEK